jgi:hypothetical protein
MPTLAKRDEEHIAWHEAKVNQSLHDDLEEGRRFCGLTALQDEEEARDTLECLGTRGPDVPFQVEPTLHDLANNRAHALSLEIAYRKGQAVTLRHQSWASVIRINDIFHAWDDEGKMDVEERKSWYKAKELNAENRFQLGSDLEWLR